jgi:branched-chain amino acid transport system ATP-binding protein
MSVVENVLVGMHTKLHSNFAASLFHLKGERKEEKEAYEKAQEWLKYVGLQERASDLAGSLSYGEQRLLEIVRALSSIQG